MARPQVSPKPIIAVVGPTASGKTRLALALARRLGCEIISADMGQLYRLLDAGTAKPEGRWNKKSEPPVYEVEGIPYHLVDVLDPAEATDAGGFARLAGPVLEDIERRGLRAIVAGGTGLYVKALLEGLDPLPRADAALRKDFLELAEKNGRAWLHARLAARDPESARRIPANNLQRVVRALEVLELTGKPISAQWSGAKASRRDAVYLGIDWETAALRERIRLRAESMFPAMLEEVRTLVPARYTGEEPGFRCLGYPQALACARAELSQEAALEAMVAATAAYAKRQRTWFRGQAPVRWLKPDADPDSIPL